MSSSVFTSKFGFTDPLIHGLACASVAPGLRSVLVFDVEPSTTRVMGTLFAQMLQVVTGRAVSQVFIGTIETEDDLWGRWEIFHNLHSVQFPLRWQPGLLGSSVQPDNLLMVVIPDLSQLSLAAMRACISVMGTEVAHLERHSQQQAWKPNLCWLAGCSRDKIGLVSPHLLDRFSLRLTGKLVSSHDRVGDILIWLESPLPDLEISPQSLSSKLIQALRSVSSKRPLVTTKILRLVEDYILILEGYSTRRAVALSRLAIAHALLEGEEQVTITHVEQAAKMVGLRPPIKTTEKSTEQADNSYPLNTFEEPRKIDTSPVQHNESKSELQPFNVVEPVYASNQTETFESTESTSLTKYEAPSDPYPEDTAPVEREAASLKLPIRRSQARAAGRGPVVGIEPARTIHDLALVSTVLEAAKYQSLRRQQSFEEMQDNLRLILSPSDLRHYRRAPVAEQMLVLVIDHTCIKERKWQEALLPYLSWAYVERASVCLVQVGAEIEEQGEITSRGINSGELRARKIVERNILVPRINTGIEANAGRATPLAHGLELALQTLRHALQHGRNTVQKALLVLVSDGRGNVPLESSYTGKIVLPVKQQGVEDALKVAEQIRLLNNVNKVFLNPQPKYCKDFPPKLAQALGVEAQNFIIIPLLEDEVVDD